jgi:hypothetical protein
VGISLWDEEPITYSNNKVCYYNFSKLFAK